MNNKKREIAVLFTLISILISPFAQADSSKCPVVGNHESSDDGGSDGSGGEGNPASRKDNCEKLRRLNLESCNNKLGKLTGWDYAKAKLNCVRIADDTYRACL